jgi:hypothetical protein
MGAQVVMSTTSEAKEPFGQPPPSGRNGTAPQTKRPPLLLPEALVAPPELLLPLGPVELVAVLEVLLLPLEAEVARLLEAAMELPRPRLAVLLR